jgi:hypothetical protein
MLLNKLVHLQDELIQVNTFFRDLCHIVVGSRLVEQGHASFEREVFALLTLDFVCWLSEGVQACLGGGRHLTWSSLRSQLLDLIKGLEHPLTLPFLPCLRLLSRSLSDLSFGVRRLCTLS